MELPIVTSDPNVLGEYLRGEFFVQWDGDKYLGRGCYTTFETQSDVIKLPCESIDLEYPEDGDYNVYYKCIHIWDTTIVMKYYWDGDGRLEFHFPTCDKNKMQGEILLNTDCKKDYVWELY